jgi:spermidine synthase
MTTSLFVVRKPQGVEFYINGDLQFDSQDEAIYHEHLVGPAIALATDRFPQQPLRVLICGGGDGLAARDVLRFASVGEVILVDYDAAVLQLARTAFAPYNQDSLNVGDRRVTVHHREAFEFVRSLPAASFHVVICDFTCPDTPEAQAIYSREWFAELRRVLLPVGVMATNGVSVDRENQAFWCIYQTLMAAGFDAKPMQLAIPSFQRHAYGLWGFFLASVAKIDRSQLTTLQFPSQFQTLNSRWQTCFEFPAQLAVWRDRVHLHTLAHPQLRYYRLNPQYRALESTGGLLYFLDMPETVSARESLADPLALSTIVQSWLRESRPSLANPARLCPVLHESQTPVMAQSWLDLVPQMLAQIDATKLLEALAGNQLPDRLQRLVNESMRSRPTLHPHQEMAIVLSAIMVTANLAVPDSGYAKGHFQEGLLPGCRTRSDFLCQPLRQLWAQVRGNQLTSAKPEITSTIISLRELQPQHQNDWDQLIGQSFMQSWSWGEFKRREGFNVLRIGMFDGDRLVGGATFYHYPRSDAANLLFSTGGPCFAAGYAAIGLPLLVEFAQTLAVQWGAIAWRMEPIEPMEPMPTDGFVRSPVDVVPIETLLIDLSQTQDELLAAMKPKGRYNIKLSQKHGVETRFTTDEQAIPRFYELFWQTSQRQNFGAEPYRYMINLCQTLFAAGIAEIGLARYQGETLATVLLIHWGDMTTYLYGGRGLAHPEVMAMYGLQWAAIERAKQRGSKWYDFYGYTQKQQHNYSQFSRFKEKFGGQMHQRQGAQDMIFYPQMAATLVDLFRTIG